MRAPETLQKALQHMEDRASTYDSPGGERSMARTVGMFRELTGGLTLSEEEGWLFMSCLKMVRSQQGKFKADNYEDGASYFALACEAAGKDRA
jgi:hypothetical protein